MVCMKFKECYVFQRKVPALCHVIDVKLRHNAIEKKNTCKLKVAHASILSMRNAELNYFMLYSLVLQIFL